MKYKENFGHGFTRMTTDGTAGARVEAKTESQSVFFETQDAL
jgi:hypothetical protein